MSDLQRRIPFKVDVAGVIRIMGQSLYSRPEAAIRELIQNCHDAIVRRRTVDLSHKGRIEIALDATAGTLALSDDGVGLSIDEAEQFLGTLGIGVTGILKGFHPQTNGAPVGQGDGLIGQFGIGLFSAFMLADTVEVESRKADTEKAVRWRAGVGTDIEIAPCERQAIGTTVRLHLKPEHRRLAESSVDVEEIVKEFADFLPVPIFIDRSSSRANVINASWFEPTVDHESLALELESHFGETPLDIVPVRLPKPAPAIGALYVTPRRTPGFSGEAHVTATVRRMVVSHHIQDLLPEWGAFLRGVLELPEAMPTASREDLVRDHQFAMLQSALAEHLYQHFESLAREQPQRMQAVLAWHRYLWAGYALSDQRLRRIMRDSYPFSTSQGSMTFERIVAASAVDPLLESDFERVIWYQTDRRQERWMNSLFAKHSSPCVHALRSFDESLLAALVADEGDGIDFRNASPQSPGFNEQVLGLEDLREAPEAWREFLAETGARIFCGSIRDDLPVMAFLNEKHELAETFESLKREGDVPAGFQRLIQSHIERQADLKNEIVLNRRHRLVARALGQSTRVPLASVLRLLVFNTLGAAGAALPPSVQSQQAADLDWVAEALWGRTEK